MHLPYTPDSAEAEVTSCRRGMERLLRKVLAMKNRPAIVNFHFYPMLRFKCAHNALCAACTGFCRQGLPCIP